MVKFCYVLLKGKYAGIFTQYSKAYMSNQEVIPRSAWHNSFSICDHDSLLMDGGAKWYTELRVCVFINIIVCSTSTSTDKMVYRPVNMSFCLEKMSPP